MIGLAERPGDARRTDVLEVEHAVTERAADTGPRARRTTAGHAGSGSAMTMSPRSRSRPTHDAAGLEVDVPRDVGHHRRSDE